MTAAHDNLADQIDAVERDILQGIFERREPLVVVDSPPGAGKTSLVQMAAAVAVSRGQRVFLATVTNDQAYDAQRRFAVDYPDVPTQLLHTAAKQPPVDLQNGIASHPPASSGRSLAGGPLVVIANATKASLSTPEIDETFDLLIVDEAYQLTWADFIYIAHLARIVVLVGDPGQLPPVIGVDTARFESADIKVHWPAPTQLLRAHPEVQSYQLPATRRLPQDTVDVVAPAFYPNLPFASAATTRRIAFAAAGISTLIDRALDGLAAGASMMCVALPRDTTEYEVADAELSATIAAIAERLLERGAHEVMTRDDEMIRASDIGVVDARVASGAEDTRRLRRAGVGPETLVNTPETWQGLERRLIIAKHPLSGTSDFTDLSLAPGRLCVMTSRHQLGCIIVTRDGVGSDLDSHVHASTRRPVGSTDVTWNGYRAHRTFWDWLENNGRIVRSNPSQPAA